jgi:hypothetical protein
MIRKTINFKIAEALKAHNELRLTTLRMLSSALNYEFISKQHDLSDDEEIVVVRREIKKRNDAVESYRQVLDKNPTHVQEKIDKELEEILILKEFLPPEMDEGELVKIIQDAISQTGATSIKDMGKVIGVVKIKVGATVDGSKIAEIVKARLQ